MNRFKRWILDKLWAFLCLDELKKNQDKWNDRQDKEIQHLKLRLSQAEERIRTLYSTIDIGADVQHREPGSFAVICVNGEKMDYVRFVNLDQKSIREIAQFLRRYEGSNRVIDAPRYAEKLWNGWPSPKHRP